MSIEKFCENLDREITALKGKREQLSGQYKGACTRKINSLSKVLQKAVRKGVR